MGSWPVILLVVVVLGWIVFEVATAPTNPPWSEVDQEDSE